MGNFPDAAKKKKPNEVCETVEVIAQEHELSCLYSAFNR
jgi:hypothetical protein